MVISPKVFGRMGQNLVWGGFSIDTSCVSNYIKIRRGHVIFWLIWFGMTLMISLVILTSVDLVKFSHVQYVLKLHSLLHKSQVCHTGYLYRYQTITSILVALESVKYVCMCCKSLLVSLSTVILNSRD